DANAPLPPTHVASYRMPAGGWQALESWPPPRTATQSLALTTSGGLSPTPGPIGSRGYVVNTGAGVVDLSSGDHLVFTGLPLAAPSTISGAAEVRLVATLTDPTHVAPPGAVDTNFVFHLYDVTASGTKTLVTRGYLKASHYKS